MALKKEIETRQGVMVEYWNIEHFEYLNMKKRLCTVILRGFVDETLYTEGKFHADSRRFVFNDSKS